MLKTVVIVVAIVVVAIVVVLLIAATRPATFRVVRTTLIHAPPVTIVALIADFHSWPSWSPYEKLDPGMQKTFSGAPFGVGAVYEWSGNSKAGQGRMQITDVAPSKVSLKLDFTRPFKAHNNVDFILEPAGDSTRVTWAMSGPNLFIGKVMGLFINMDTLVGKDFESGLANLKTAAEKP